MTQTIEQLVEESRKLQQETKRLLKKEETNKNIQKIYDLARECEELADKDNRQMFAAIFQGIRILAQDILEDKTDITIAFLADYKKNTTWFIESINKN